MKRRIVREAREASLCVENNDVEFSEISGKSLKFSSPIQRCRHYVHDVCAAPHNRRTELNGFGDICYICECIQGQDDNAFEIRRIVCGLCMLS